MQHVTGTDLLPGEVPIDPRFAIWSRRQPARPQQRSSQPIGPHAFATAGPQRATGTAVPAAARRLLQRAGTFDLLGDRGAPVAEPIPARTPSAARIRHRARPRTAAAPPYGTRQQRAIPPAVSVIPPPAGAPGARWPARPAGPTTMMTFPPARARPPAVPSLLSYLPRVPRRPREPDGDTLPPSTRYRNEEEPAPYLGGLPPELADYLLRMLSTGSPQDALRLCATNRETRALCQARVIPWWEQFGYLGPYMDRDAGDRASVLDIARAAIPRGRAQVCIPALVRGMATGIDPDLGDDMSQWPFRPATQWSYRANLYPAGTRHALLTDVMNPERAPIRVDDADGLVYLDLSLGQFPQFDSVDPRAYANRVLNRALGYSELFGGGADPEVCSALMGRDIVSMVLDTIPGARLFIAEVTDDGSPFYGGLVLALPGFGPEAAIAEPGGGEYGTEQGGFGDDYPHLPPLVDE